MLLRNTRSALLASVALIVSGHALADPVPQAIVETVGGVPFTLPIPPGYAPPADTPPTFNSLVLHAVPPTNRLVMSMLTRQFMGELTSADPTPRKARYLIVQTFRGVEQSGASAAMFEQLKTVLRTQSAQVLERVKPSVDDTFDRLSADVGKMTGDSAANVRSSDQHVLGIFDEQPDSISMCVVQTLSGAVRDEKMQMKQAMAATVVRLHGQVLMVAFYSKDDSQADVGWVEDQARAWNKRVHELNP